MTDRMPPQVEILLPAIDTAGVGPKADPKTDACFCSVTVTRERAEATIERALDRLDEAGGRHGRVREVALGPEALVHTAAPAAHRHGGADDLVRAAEEALCVRVRVVEGPPDAVRPITDDRGAAGSMVRDHYTDDTDDNDD